MGMDLKRQRERMGYADLLPGFLPVHPFNLMIDSLIRVAIRERTLII